MKHFIAIALLALPLVACEKKEEPKPQTSVAPTAAPTPTQAATGSTEPASATADESADIPTEQDFEEEAEQKITAENLETELDKLEKEIGEGS
jgi:hypothetical protein